MKNRNIDMLNGPIFFKMIGYTMPHSGNWEQGKIYKQAEQFNFPPYPIQTCFHEGIHQLPMNNSFYSIEGDVVVSSFKKAEDSNSYILRLYNPSGKEQNCTFTIAKPIKEAYITNLNEQRQKRLPVDDNIVRLTMLPNKIVTVEIAVS